MISPNQIRKIALKMIYDKKSGHIGGSFSLAELIAYLYTFYEIEESKNQLVLSKGHAVPIIYAALNALGIINDDELSTFREVNSRLQGHPYSPAMPKHIHATTGSLGQGLSIAIGKAIALKRLSLPYKIFCILGDGELQEGQNWEALMFAPKEELDNLIVFVDVNGYQLDTATIYDKQDYLRKYPFITNQLGWCSISGDGHNYQFLTDALKYPVYKQPKIVYLDTIKGKGVSFMENNVDYHSKIPNEQEYELAMKELNYDK